jgi:hypothetical protein
MPAQDPTDRGRRHRDAAPFTRGCGDGRAGGADRQAERLQGALDTAERTGDGCCGLPPDVRPDEDGADESLDELTASSKPGTA